MKTITCKLMVLLLSSLVFSISAFASTDSFIITIDRGSSNFTIPTEGTGYNYKVHCGDDGVAEENNQTGDYTCEYMGLPESSNIQTITIDGAFPRIYFNSEGDASKILSVDQWGTQQWTSMENAFYYATNLEINATDTPDLSLVHSMKSMFRNAYNFNQDIGDWNVSNVTDMSYMFEEAYSFNQDIGDWNVSSVTNMEHMFYEATAFNQPIGNWNVSKVTNMSYMLGRTDFNQDIGDWDVSNVTNMYRIFLSANTFNQDIGDWNVSEVTNMNGMFENACSFNQDIGSWNITNVTDMGGMFEDVNLSISHYDNLLLSWADLPVQTNVEFYAGNSDYCEGESGKSILNNTYHWDIMDNTKDCSYYINSSTAISVRSGKTEVGLVTTIGGTPEYSIVGGADGILFDIDILTGKLNFLTAPDIENPTDHNQDNIYRVQVQSTDGSSSDIQTIRITVKDNFNEELVPIISYLLF